MATVKEHYENVLSDVYSWMYGGFEENIRRYAAFFKDNGITPQGSGVAVDLGAGCGFQSIPLAKLGYSVTAIDIDAKLIKELEENAAGLTIKTVQGDLMNFEESLNEKAEAAICMTDTLLHLDSKEMVSALFKKVYAALESGGKFVISFRDLTYELKETDRFLPVRSDENTIFTCFLEYEAETVKVHDIVHQKVDGAWQFSKSFYRKLRLSEAWMTEQLTQAGFNQIDSSMERGVITLIAHR